MGLGCLTPRRSFAGYWINTPFPASSSSGTLSDVLQGPLWPSLSGVAPEPQGVGNRLFEREVRLVAQGPQP